MLYLVLLLHNFYLIAIDRIHLICFTFIPLLEQFDVNVAMNSFTSQ